MASGAEDDEDEIFFLVINLINRAGPEMVIEPSQRPIIKAL